MLNQFLIIFLLISFFYFLFLNFKIYLLDLKVTQKVNLIFNFVNLHLLILFVKFLERLKINYKKHFCNVCNF